MTADLIAFLRDRIADDERLARAGAEGTSIWHDGSVGESWAADRGLVFGAKVALWDCEGADSLCMPELTADHVARHDPARVLADVASKRHLIIWLESELAVDYDSHGELADLVGGRLKESFSAALKVLALPYADHPDYREDFRP